MDNNIVTDLLGKIVYINLDTRTDRRDLTEIELQKGGLVAERVSAVVGNPGYEVNIKPGEVGCLLSHMKCIQIAKDRGWDKILIFEDDIEVRDDFKTLFDTYCQQVPDNWDMIYLGGNHWGRDLSMKNHPPLVKITENVSRTTHTLTTHAYIMKNTMYDRTIDYISNMSQQVDMLYVKLQNEFNTYAFRPSLVWQRKDVSDINHKLCDYYFIKDW
jgi:glycosyl transferase, family 25